MKRLVETILVVEDNEDSRSMLHDLLTHAGFRVVTADNGADALRHLRAELPDLVVLDLMLPWVNGVEVLSTLRSIPGAARVPVLVVTATNTTAFDLRAYEPLVLMRKPLNTPAIVPAVQELLARSDRGQS